MKRQLPLRLAYCLLVLLPWNGAMAIDGVEMNRRLIQLSKFCFQEPALDDSNMPLDPRRVFCAVWTLEADVNNGGFDQYFFNSSGRYAGHVVASLQAISAFQTAAIVQEAIDILGPDTLWVDDMARQERLLEVRDAERLRFESVDKQFFCYPDDLTTLLYRFVSAHRDEFGLSADF